MTSVEKRRSGRKSGGHRKHSDGGYSDTSSAGSFPDETDREVSSLTDRAFRSLCIGDEAVYNDSDLGASSPCTQRDRQLAFSQSAQDRDGEREELKRTAHESFSLRMQQYEQNWIHGGMYGAEIQRDPQWEDYGERTQGRVSATFQQSFVETSQQEAPLRGEQLSFLSNGATEVSSQQRRSRSRVSSLIRAFNSEGQRDGAGMDGKLRELNDDTSWDKSALMSIQRELSEFSTSYQDNFNSGHFSSAGPFSSRDAGFYSSEVAAMSHINSGPSFMRSSHSKHSMSTQVNCNSNFFIHSEFSPFKVWRDHNRFPFQQGEVSGFMRYPDFPKWYETPMYKELSLESQPQVPYRFEERGMRNLRNNWAPVVPPSPPRATSTSTMLHRASAVEKRCDSELAGHYTYRKRAQSLGTNRLQPQRPSTASPTIEMSRRVQDTISSVKALQQKIKMMTEQNISTEMTMHKQGVSYSNDYRIPYGNDAKSAAPNVVSSNTSTTPFNISQLLTPVVHAHQESETSEVRQSAVSPQLVEHPPVRAESRGATPDIRMSSYKSRATSLLFNLKDNRKRVKSTYSPTKFKGLETQDKNKQPLIQEPRDTVIDIPDFPDAEYPQVEESGWTNAVSHNYANQYFSPGSSFATNYEPAAANTGQYSEYTSSDYQTAQMQGEMVHHSGFTGFIPENYTSSQLANGQNLYEDLSSFTPYQQGMMDNVDTQGRDGYMLKPPYTATQTPWLNAENNHTREFLTQVDGYQQHKDSGYDYTNVSSQDMWRQANSQDTKYHSLSAESYPWKQEITASVGLDQHYQRAAMTKEELHLPRDKYRVDSHHDIHKEPQKKQSCEDFGGTSYAMDGFINSNISNQHPQYGALGNNTRENQAYYGHQQPGAFKDNYGLQKQSRHNKENEMNDYTPKTSNRFTDQENRNQHTPILNKDYAMLTQETGQINPYTTIPNGYEMQSLQPEETKPPFEHNMLNSAKPANVTDPAMENRAKDRSYDGVKAEQAMAAHVKAQHAQAELAVAQHWAKEQRPKEELAGLNLAGQTGSEEVKAEHVFAELSAQERVNLGRAEHVEEIKKKDYLIEQSTEKQPEQTSEVLTKAEQTIVPRVTEPSHITEEAAEHMKEEQEGQVKAEQAEAERFKEHIKTELEETEQTRIQQSKTEKAKLERIKAEKLEEEKLRAEEAERERITAEQIRTEKVKAEQAEAERRKVAHAELRQIEEQAKAEREKVEVGDKNVIQATHVNDANLTTQKSNAKVERVEEKEGEQENSKQTKVITTKLEQTKTEMMQEESAKPAPKLISSQQVKSEPDKVEQAKTELAKAKAELAKIKEKMKGDQKQKVKNTVLTKDDEIKKDVPADMDADKNEEFKYQDQSTQPEHQQNKDLIVTFRQSIDQANRGLDEFNRLRDKYGFTDTPTVRNKISAAGNSSSNDANETPLLCLDTFERKTEEKSKDKLSPTRKFATSDTENNNVSSFESPKLTEGQYIYSESSKEFKLSSGNNALPDGDNVTKSDSITDEVKEHRVEKLETCDPLIQPDVSQQKDSNLVSLLPAGRKPKLTEQSVGPSKDPHSNPPKTLSHKERAQTKQEILTSKIKAHAEKEISAIKEKGFAKRDGIISKTSTKQLGGNQFINARQKPPSQDAPKKHDSTISSNATLKHHMEPQGTKMVPAKSALPSSSATIPVKSAATTSQSLDQSQKVLKEPMNGDVPKPPTESKLTTRTDNGLVEHQNKENRSPIHSKEQPPKTKQLKQESDLEENSGNKTDGPKDNLILDTVNLIKEKEARPVVEVKSSKATTTEKAESTHEAVLEDSSLNIVFGQIKTPVADDSLQIRGIMVTVRERKPSLSDVEINSPNTPDQINAKESRNSELKEGNLSSDPETSKGNTSLNTKVESKDKVIQGTHPTMIDDKTKVGMKIHPENIQGASTRETKQNNMFETVTLQQESSYADASPQRETQLQEPAREKVSPSNVTVPAKNKTLAETQSLLYNQDIIPGETKDFTNVTPIENRSKSIGTDEVKVNVHEKNPPKSQTTHANDSNVVAKQINQMNDCKRDGAESLIKQNIKPLVKEDMSTVINPSNSRDTDGKSAPLLDEKKHHSTPPKPLSKTSASHNLTDNENRQVENNQVDDSVHIDSIAIRVVSAVTEDNITKGEKHVTAVASDEATANDQVASSSVEGKLKKDNRTKDLNAASSENQFEINLEDNLLVQSVLSSVRKLSDSLKNNNQQESINATSQNVQDETGEHESINASGNSVDESKTHPTEEDYFQVQGTAETNHKPHRKANVADSSDAVSKGRDLPGLQSKKGLFSKESDNERKNEVFMLDQSLRKTTESRSVSIQEENAKRNNGETEDKLASKQSDGPTERPGSKNEKSQVGQAVHIRKQQTESKSTLSLRERQSLRNSNPTRESGGEKPEVKPTPKPRASTIPEISALADYARLKVIVSEDRDDTIQEFPPNKKEGFFPLIQSRHSRRPVFTADPQDFPVKEKTLPNKTEVSSKVNKEPKPLVFPITEKEHQRTGMFKLGDKERQEKLLLDAKANEDTQVKNAQHIQGRIKSPTSHVKKERIEEAPLTDMQRAHQIDERTHQSNNPPLQAPASSSALNRPRQRNTSVTQQMKPSDNTNPNEKLQEFSPTAERIPCLDKNPHPKPTLVQGNNMEDSTRTSRKTQKIENAKTDNLEKPTPPHEDTKPKQQNRAKQSEVKHTSRTDDTEDVKIKHIIAESRASLAEEERKAAKREEERRTREREAIANRIKERREKQREADRREEEERKGKHTEGSRAAQKEKMRANQRQEEKLVKEIEEIRELIAEEQQGKHREQQRLASQEVPRRRAASNERQRRAAQEEQQTRAAKEELHRKRAAEEEQKRRAAQEEQQRRAVEVEQQRKAAQEEQQRRDAHEEQQRRAAQKEQERKAALEEEQKRAVQEELKNRAAQEEQQRRAAQKEQERKAALEEEQKRAAQQEQQMRAAHEEQQRRAFQEGQQRKRAAEEEKQRIVAQKEQERIAALEEQQKRAALEAQQTRAALEEQQRRAAQEEQQRIAALEEQQRRAAQEEQQRIAALEEQQRRTAHEEQQRIAALEEQQRRAAHEEQQRMAALEEQQRRAAHEEQQWRASLIEEQRLARQTEEKILTDIEERKKINQRDQEQPADISEQKRFNLIQEQRKTEQHTEEQREGRQKKEERARVLEKSQAAPNDEKRGAQERMLDQKEGRERDKAAQRMEALQYYAITSTDSERKPKERQIYSPLPPQQKNNPVGPESSEDSGSHSRSYRPHAPASPAPSLPRSNTSSPALGAKPSMFRVKDNSFRGSSFTKSVKPRFHKSFGEDYRVGSPMERERREDEQDILRWSAGTPVHPDRLAAIRELSSFPPTSSSQDYSVPLPQHRPYSRRSIALDEDDSRSVVSNMSEGVESFATSAADLSDIRSSYYDERPESACSFSSDVSRSMGKPPTVPPKSEKALRRAKRLTSRRINKEKPKAGADGPAGVEKPLQDVSGIPSSSSTEVCSSNRHAVASPHFTPPLSLALAPALGSSLPSSSTEHQSSHSSFHASPHATAPVSLPVASPHATAPVSLPIVSTHATGPASHTAAPKTVAHIPSSPTLHHANRPATVTQYHVESSYPQSYPLTQRKVLQDLGSGQYFVVDVPVQVKTKTFIDPETGKYVQLNVRESAQSNPRPQPKLQPQPQQTYLQPQLQPQMQVKPQQQQQQPLSQPSPAGKPAVFYEGYQGYQPAANKFVPHNRSSAPGTPYQDQQPVREGHIYGYQAPEIIANSEGPRYSPEKTPYMDTVNDSGKTHNTVYNTHGPYESFPECDTNSQLAGSQVRENDNSAHSRYQPQEIIAISELEDFMEVSDW